jgi:serine protease Do
MPVSTNHLVVVAQKSIIPASIAGAFVLGAALFAGNGGVHAAMNTTPQLDDKSVAALVSLDRAMEAVTSKVTPSIVNVEVTSRSTDDQDTSQNNPMLQNLPPGFQQFFGPGLRMQPQRPQIEHGIGSGVIISPDGYIVTNNHVVQGATKIKVTMDDRRIFTGRVIGTDKLTDLAVIKIDAQNLPAISWGDSTKLQPGETVLAFGSPFGSLRFSVTRGIVSAINRPNPYNDDARKPGAYIQTDAAINPGNSGGALVDAYGQLVGINTFIISDSGSFAGAGFAIPSQIAQATAQQLIAHGKVDHGYLGISMNDVNPENAHFFDLKDASGAIVAQVTPGSPASKGGVEQGDVIVGYDGHKIFNGSDLQVAVSEMRPGTALNLQVQRNGSPVTLHLTVGEYHPGGQTASNDQGDEGNGQPGGTGKLGLAVGNLDDNTRQQLNAPDNIKGVVVQNVRPDSPADDAGLQPGDIILQVNRRPATDANQFVGQIHSAPQGKDILLLVWSKGNASYRTLTPAGAQDNQNGQ